MKTIRSTNGFMFNTKVIATQFELIVEFLRSFTYYNTLHKSLKLKQLKNDEQFWIHSLNSFLNNAIIQWCKVFGTDSNESHWKKAINEYDINFQEAIKDEILKSTNFSFDEWKNYHKEMRNFRNVYSAHRHTSNLPLVPFLDKAFKVTTTYFDFMHRELPLLWSQDSKEIKMEFEKEVESLLSKIIK